MLALAWDLRVHELERAFALSIAPQVSTPSESVREWTAQERALACVRIAATQWAIQEIEAALTRIEDGEYGDCEWCTRPIPHELLAVAPMRRLCRQCWTGQESTSEARHRLARSSADAASHRQGGPSS
jgi:DnaK suppressor protein